MTAYARAATTPPGPRTASRRADLGLTPPEVGGCHPARRVAARCGRRRRSGVGADPSCGGIPRERAHPQPETATAEHTLEPPRSEAVSLDEPDPHEPGGPETVELHADASDTPTPEHASELTTPPEVRPPQPQPPAVDAPSAILPPLPRTEPRLEGAAPQPSASAPAQVDHAEPWRHEVPPRPSPPAKVEALSPLPRTEPRLEGNAAVHSVPLTPQPAVPAKAQVELAEPWPRQAPLRPSPPAKVEAPRYLVPALKLAAAVLLALAGSVLLLVILYRWVDPPASTLMLGQRLLGTPITQRWVPLARISPNLPVAVILSEDARFCRHSGVDWGELRDAIDSAADGVARGGSTISMQVVKNLFLWPSKSYLRKALEIPLAYLIEMAWPKQRILEIYLNVAMGTGCVRSRGGGALSLQEAGLAARPSRGRTAGGVAAQPVRAGRRQARPRHTAPCRQPAVADAGRAGNPQAACAPVRQANSRLADSLWPWRARAAISPAAEQPPG